MKGKSPTCWYSYQQPWEAREGTRQPFVCPCQQSFLGMDKVLYHDGRGLWVLPWPGALGVLGSCGSRADTGFPISQKELCPGQHCGNHGLGCCHPPHLQCPLEQEPCWAEIDFLNCILFWIICSKICGLLADGVLEEAVGSFSLKQLNMYIIWCICYVVLTLP